MKKFNYFCSSALKISAILIAALWVDSAMAAATIKDISSTIVNNSMEGLAKLIAATAYVAGMGFMFAAVLKFKAHKDNPTQIPVGTPIALTFVAACLLFLPTLYGVLGETVFGSDKKSGGISGVGYSSGI